MTKNWVRLRNEGEPMEQQLKNFKNCLQKEIPFCAAECPFHLDILNFIEKMKRSGFKGAFKTYRNAVGFPAVVSSLCPEPCKGVCPHKDSDASIELRLLEQACVAYTGDRSSTDYNLPMKKKKVAIIGAGPSGLACALRLCMKKYGVEIFEEKDRIGGTLWELLEPEIFLSDIKEQFKHEAYTLHLDTPVRSIHELEARGFDAVYVATGNGGEDFGLLTGAASFCALYNGAGWFAGGGLTGAEPIYALAEGLHMGTVIDSFLKTGNLLYPQNERKTGMCLNPSKLKFLEAVRPSGEGQYSKEEAALEAARCLECQCDFCRTYCDLTEFYNKWPLRIRDEILATTLPGSAEVKATPAKRLLSTCNQCGLCKETCPEDIDLGGLILEGRKSMHRQKKAPWVFHDFWLRDMDFADGLLAAVSKRSPFDSQKTRESGTQGCTSSDELGTYAFFPGCQLGASDPELVEKTYAHLLDSRPDTGLLLRCCGAPAEWSGDEEKHQNAISAIRKLWQELGNPTLIMACPTCEKKFKTYLEEIPVISLYEILDLWGSAPSEDPAVQPAEDSSSERGLTEVDSAKMTTFSIFDACASRHEPEMRASVRRLAERLGYTLEPLAENDANPHCCSFGGQPAVANPEYASFVTQKRISELEQPYITYCINCRDVFLDAGKETVHLLDLIFGRETPVKLPTVSQRRENRILLKERILEAYWGEDVAASRNSGVKLEISAELSDKLSRERILEEDIVAAVEFCQRTGRRVKNPDKGSYSGYKEVGYTTYWVEYCERDEGGLKLLNAYAHHMKIELEAVWNGRKIDVDQ